MESIPMMLTDWIMLVFIAGPLLYTIYDDIITGLRKGQTLLKIPLLRRGRIDGFIVSLLVLIVLWQNISTQGAMITNWLLGVLVVQTIYLCGLRQPHILFKQQGFFFRGMWIDYQRINSMNLSNDGVLVIGLEKRRLLISVRNIDDLEKIYKFLINIH